jgi:hypothetical protein
MLVRLALAASLALAAGTAYAQPQTMPAQRISGTVKSVASGHLVVTTDKGDVDLVLPPQTPVMGREPAAATDIKAGSYLGTANQTIPEGGRATEVHMMDNGPNVNSPMNQPGLIMTNGHVKSVQNTAKGQEMDVDYGEGTRHVIVPANTPVSRMVDKGPSALKPGTRVSVIPTPGADGKLTARYIILAPPK